MSNLEKAAEIIAEARRTAPRVRDMQDHVSPHIAQALADAGLLAAELPQANDPGIFVPGGKGWRMGDVSVWTAPDSPVMVQNVEPGDLSPSSARELALALLAAANYAEEKNQ